MSARNEMASYMWRRVRKGKARAMDIDIDIDIEDASPGVSNPNPLANEGLEDEPFPPPPINDERACKRCPRRRPLPAASSGISRNSDSVCLC